jgi:hypothetical protein
MGSLNRFNLAKIKNIFDISSLLETGTYKGGGVRHAVNHGIDLVHSIEIDPILYLQNQLEFSTLEKVFIHLGSSHEVIPLLLPHLESIENPMIFWLDAHFPFADSGMHAYNYEQDDLRRMPIISEISSIVSARPHHKDIIIIDDLRCFIDDDRIPADPFDVHMAKLGTRGAGCTRQNVVGVNISDITNILSPFYSTTYIMLDEGYAFFSPKDKQFELATLLLN